MCPIMLTFVGMSHITVGTGSATTVGSPFASSNPSDPVETAQALVCPRASKVRDRISYTPAGMSNVGEITYWRPSLGVSR